MAKMLAKSHPGASVVNSFVGSLQDEEPSIEKLPFVSLNNCKRVI